MVRVADAGGSKVIVVAADNPGLVGFYGRNEFEGKLARHLASDRWFLDESYVKVSGVWR